MIRKQHADHLKLLSRLLLSGESTQTELGLLNITVSSAKIPELQKRIQQFQDELIGWLQSEEHPDTIDQLGTYMFKVVKSK